ncbi:hypothetical protein [Frigoribacterium salinisoli]
MQAIVGRPTPPRADPTLAAPSTPLEQRDGRDWVRAIAALALVALGARVPLPQGLQLGFVVAVALLPVWWRTATAHRAGATVAASTVLAAVAGVWLAAANAGDHDVDRTGAVQATVLLVGGLASAGLLLWCRSVLTTWRALVWYGTGLALALFRGSTLFETNPWKFGFALPVTVVALALAMRLGRRWEIAVLSALAVASALNDSRSAFGLLLVAAGLCIAQLDLRGTARRRSPAVVLVTGAALAAGVYQLGQALILDGYLGLATQQRSLEQLRTSGSLIVGGRPELGASRALFEDHPWGYGAGTLPTAADVAVAKQGMAETGYDPDNGYVERFMFGDGFELHSVVGDLWAQSGLAGLLLSAVLLVVIAWGVVTRVADRRASGLLLFVAANAVWNLFFSPVLTSIPTLVLTLGLLSALPADGPGPISRPSTPHPTRPRRAAP